MIQERNSTKYDQYAKRLEEAANQLEAAHLDISKELDTSGSKIKDILKNTIEPLAKKHPFPSFGVFAKFYGEHAIDVFLPTRENKPGLLLDQNEQLSVFLSSEGEIFKAKTYKHGNGMLSVNLEESEEIPLEEYVKYGPKALEGVLSFWREYFLVPTT